MSKILLAEDEPALLESYAEIVQGLGHDCVCAFDGHHALELARQEQPDLVITDYMMPRKDGAELIRALRIDPSLEDVPIILMSAARPPERDSRDAWLCLPKPVSVDRLESAVKGGLAVSARTRRGAKADGAATVADPAEHRLAREEMLSWVSHEIKSPLAAAVTATELGLRDARVLEAAVVERRFIMIARQLRRMDELVTSLLDAAQLEDGRLTLDCEPIDLAALLESAIPYWRELHPDVSFEPNLEERPIVSADAGRLRQVVDNLLSNAVKYGRPSNRIDVSVCKDERGRACLAVSDGGPGIPPDQLRQVFDRFHRVPGQRGRGHGLGLYIAAALARLHGGLLEVESQLGTGSTFRLVLPSIT